MSNYNEIRALEAILFSESEVDQKDLSLLAYALVAHYEWTLSYDQIDWIVEGVIAERAEEAWLDLLDPSVTIH
jgi:ethanolamine utilization protein EutQ (cupin superfamily)